LHPANRLKVKEYIQNNAAPGAQLFHTSHWFENEYVVAAKVKAEGRVFLATYKETHWTGITWLLGGTTAVGLGGVVCYFGSPALGKIIAQTFAKKEIVETIVTWTINTLASIGYVIAAAKAKEFIQHGLANVQKLKGLIVEIALYKKLKLAYPALKINHLRSLDGDSEKKIDFFL